MRGGARRLVGPVVALLLAVAMAVVVRPAGAGGATAQYTAVPIASLPAPFSHWNVQVAPQHAGNDRVLTLTFDSPLFERRVTNTVYLPDDYAGATAKTPVVYALHGTVLSYIDNCGLNPITSLETLVRVVGCGGGYLQDQLYDIPSQLGRMHFAVVSPDTDPNVSVCETCIWVNGRNDLVPNIPPITARQLPGDSFLHQELYPLAEALFNLRSDRAGRGVMGFSEGGWAAALQAMIHPDEYSYIGYISGGYDIKEPLLSSDIIEPVGYFRDQGYSTQYTDPVWWAQYNPKDIATNISGADIAFLLTSGDGCLSVADLTDTYCQGKFSPVRTPVGSILETELGHNREIAVADLAAKHIPFTTHHTAGTHGANNADMFAQYVVPGANAKFAATTTDPATFSYRSALPDFSVWGYHVTVTKAQDGFVDLTGVAADGRTLTLTGAGTAAIATPARFTPGSTYAVRTTHGSATTNSPATADAGGRLHLRVVGDAVPTTVRVG